MAASRHDGAGPEAIGRRADQAGSQGRASVPPHALCPSRSAANTASRRTRSASTGGPSVATRRQRPRISAATRSGSISAPSRPSNQARLPRSKKLSAGRPSASRRSWASSSTCQYVPRQGGVGAVEIALRAVGGDRDADGRHDDAPSSSRSAARSAASSDHGGTGLRRGDTDFRSRLCNFRGRMRPRPSIDAGIDRSIPPNGGIRSACVHRDVSATLCHLGPSG